jgi:hypothetical protein
VALIFIRSCRQSSILLLSQTMTFGLPCVYGAVDPKLGVFAGAQVRTARLHCLTGERSLKETRAAPPGLTHTRKLTPVLNWSMYGLTSPKLAGPQSLRPPLTLAPAVDVSQWPLEYRLKTRLPSSIWCRRRAMSKAQRCKQSSGLVNLWEAQSRAHPCCAKCRNQKKGV